MWKRMLLLGACAAMLGGCGGLAEVKEQRELELPMEGISKLRIETGAGKLIVKGDPAATEIIVNGEIRRSKNVKKSKVVFELEKKGEIAELTSDFKGGFGFEYMNLDMTVTLPSDIALEIDDGSDNIEIRDVLAPIQIKDGSGELLVERSGPIMEITDGSGSIDLTETKGDLVLDDESGNITMKGHEGAIQILDGSGDIHVHDVQGDVTIAEDGSGSVKIKNVSGQVNQ